MVMEDHHAERLSARTRELMAESGLSWRQAWWQAEDELDIDLERHRRPPFRSSRRFNTVWVTAGFALALVPGIVAQIVQPGWATLPSQEAEIGTAVYLGLLAVSGLVVVAIGLRFGLTGRSSEGWAAALRMYVGVVVGMWIAGIIIGWDAYDAGALAAFMMILIGVPYWVCAASSLGLGSAVFKIRTKF